MYNSNKTAQIIKQRAKEKNIVIKIMLEEINLNSNAMSAMYHGKNIASDSLAKIADYLDCSVDYLLGRTDKPDAESNELASKNVKFIGKDGTVKFKKISPEMIAILEQLPDSDDKL